MKNTMYALLGLWTFTTAIPVFGQVEADTLWWSVSPTNTVSSIVGSVPVAYTNGFQSGTDTWSYEGNPSQKLTSLSGNRCVWSDWQIGSSTVLEFRNGTWSFSRNYIDSETYSVKTSYFASVSAPWEAQRLVFVDGTPTTLVRSGANSPNIVTNTIGKIVGSMAKGIDVTPVELSTTAVSNGVTFVDQYGENQNAAIEIGGNARAKMSEDYVESHSTTTVLRSVSIAIGDHADAYVEGSPKSQAIAIGWHAQAKGSNAIAIGNGAEHPGESAADGTGDATYASSSEAVSLGYSARATALGATALGGRARAQAERSVQLGTGVNSTPRTLQFLDFTLCDATGQIPSERLETAESGIYANVLAGMDRALHPGNMTAVGNGRDDQTIEPRLNGLSEMELVPGSNDLFYAGTEVYVEPPLGSRNYDVVVDDIPDVIKMVDGVPTPMPVEENLLLSLAELTEPRKITLWCDQSIGYATNGLIVVLTNAPCIVKIREPSTNKLFCVIKPWNLIDNL